MGGGLITDRPVSWGGFPTTLQLRWAPPYSFAVGGGLQDECSGKQPDWGDSIHHCCRSDIL